MAKKYSSRPKLPKINKGRNPALTLAKTLFKIMRLCDKISRVDGEKGGRSGTGDGGEGYLGS